MKTGIPVNAIDDVFGQQQYSTLARYCGSELLTRIGWKTMLFVLHLSDGTAFSFQNAINCSKKQFGVIMNFSAQRAIVGSMMVAIGLACLCPSFAFGQKKYPDPYHPTVEKLAKGAARYLESNPPGKIQEKAIGALAVVECYKRYDGSVPTDVPFIEDTVGEIQRMVDGGSAEIASNRETYFPAIAFILLAEYDAKKYEEQCTKILDVLIARQMDVGAFTYINDPHGDTSQSQFGALALYVARQHEFPLDPNVVKKLLGFYVDYQTDNGTWPYKARRPNDTGYPGTNSIHSASLSSVYLLGDLLRLSRRVKKVAGTSSVDSALNLPPNVTFYNPKKDNAEGRKERKAWGGGDGKSPVVKFDRGRLSSCKSAGNQWYSSQFRLPANKWNSYFMYALERYCYFKEQAEGNLPRALSTWYDRGVDHIIEFRAESGALDSKTREKTLSLGSNTALYLLFLVRASEIISLPPVGTEMDGGEGFEPGELRQGRNGRVESSATEKSLQGLIDALSDGNLDDRQLQQITDAMKRAIREFKQSGDRSRGEITAFLKTMISEKNYYRRLVAIKFLAAEQEMDNVPALLYAMGDPDPEIAIQAHNGLRLISRKFDTFSFEDRGNKDDNLLALARLKLQWTKWYLDIRPGAELLE